MKFNLLKNTCQLTQSKASALNQFVFGLLTFGFLAGCATSTSEFRAEPARVATIRSVAVVAFTVPEYVVEKDPSQLASFMALFKMTKQIVNNEKVTGNGQAVAQEALAGFIETMAKEGKLQFLSMNQVVGNTSFNALRDTYGQKPNGSKATLPGLPIINVDAEMPRSEFAALAAKALGVDGVIFVDAHELNYQLYTGTAGTGDARAYIRALFKLFDKNGGAVWESGVVARSEGNAAMVAGAINPLQAATLNRSIGATIASELQKTYAKSAK
jgi:hypothetical protein